MLFSSALWEENLTTKVDQHYWLKTHPKNLKCLKFLLKTFDNIWICTLPLTNWNTQLKETTLLGFLVLDLNLINKISKGFDFTPTQCNSRWTKKLFRYISFSLHFININIFESSKVFKFWEVGIGLYSTNLYCRLEDINTCYCVKCTFVDILMLAILLQTVGFFLGQLYCLIV